MIIEIDRLRIKLDKDDVPEEQTPLDVAEEFVINNFKVLQLDLRPSPREKRRTSTRRLKTKNEREVSGNF